MQIRVWRNALFKHWGKACLGTPYLTLEHERSDLDVPIIGAPATHRYVQGEGEAAIIFVRGGYTDPEFREAQETVVRMMGVNKLARQVVL